MKAIVNTHGALWTVEYEVVAEGKAALINYSRAALEDFESEQEFMHCALEGPKGTSLRHLSIRPSINAGDDSAIQVYRIIGMDPTVSEQVGRDSQRMKAIQSLNGSVSTIEYMIFGKNAVILSCSTTDTEGYAREYELSQYELTEIEKREITRLLIKPLKAGEQVNDDNATAIYELINPMDTIRFRSINTPNYDYTETKRSV